jgi:fibronectin-binding autotransporter adhesin
MRNVFRSIAFVAVAWLASSTAATSFAQDTGAKASGNWENASIWTGGTVPNSSNNVYIGSIFPSGSASVATVTLTASESAGFVTVGDGSGTSGTLNLGGNALTASYLSLGFNQGTGSLVEGTGGSFTATSATVGNGSSLTFGNMDAVLDLTLQGGSAATTAATGNVTRSVNVYTGSTLTAGADLNLSGTLSTLNVQDSGSVLNMQGHNITAPQVYLGRNGSSAVTLQNLGGITTSSLVVGNGMSLNITSADTIGLFSLFGGTSTISNTIGSLSLSNGAMATTTATGSVTGNVGIGSGSTLTLGADLNPSLSPLSFSGNTINVRDSGSTLDAQGHAVTTNTLYAGWSGTSSVTVSNLGQVTLDNLYVGNSTVGSNLTLHGGDVIDNGINLRNGSVLTVDQTGGIGLTLNGTSLSNLSLASSSMDLVFSATAAGNWDFRWQDPSGGNWISTIDGMIANGQINLTLLPGQTYAVEDSGGYTYIIGIGGSAVPEPSTLVLAGLATAGVAVGLTWQRRRTRR